MRKKFIAQTGPNNTIKLFEAETGRLYRMISVGENISSQPICTENEVFVSTTTPSGKQQIKYFALPGGNLLRTVSN
jgi:effector-binding domain-containing protein